MNFDRKACNSLFATPESGADLKLFFDTHVQPDALRNRLSALWLQRPDCYSEERTGNDLLGLCVSQSIAERKRIMLVFNYMAMAETLIGSTLAKIRISAIEFTAEFWQIFCEWLILGVNCILLGLADLGSAISCALFDVLDFDPDGQFCYASKKKKPGVELG